MSEDLISRQAAIRFIRDKVSLSLFMKRSVDKADKACMELCEMLDKDLPSAERRGRWIDTEHAPNGLFYATCSVCGKRQAVECTNYCGNCGARMEASEWTGTKKR